MFIVVHDIVFLMGRWIEDFGYPEHSFTVLVAKTADRGRDLMVMHPEVINLIFEGKIGQIDDTHSLKIQLPDLEELVLGTPRVPEVAYGLVYPEVYSICKFASEVALFPRPKLEHCEVVGRWVVKKHEGITEIS